jgi:mono/diheme cytochrome c family protein
MRTTWTNLACIPWRLVPLVVLLTAGCDLPGQPDPAHRPVPEDRVVSFEVLYGRHCAGCHGANGQMGPAPPLNDPLFRFIVPMDELEDVIKSGRPRTLMPAFGRKKEALPKDVHVPAPLNEEQVRVLVFEIKGIRYKAREWPGIEVERDPEGADPKWGIPGQPSEPPPPYLAKKGDTPGDSKRGEKVFATACAGCHGAQGLGELENGRRGPVIHDSAFLALLSDQALRRLVITGRPDDLKMPSYLGRDGRPPSFTPLTSQDVADLVALLAAWRQEGSVSSK